MLDIFNWETDVPAILRTSPDRNFWQETQFQFQFQFQGMRDSFFFPPLASPFCMSGNQEAEIPLSDSSLEPERSNTFGSGFLHEFPLSNDLQLGSFNPLPLVCLPSAEGEGLNSSSMYMNTVHQRINPPDPDHRLKPMQNIGKRSSIEVSEIRETTTAACKRRKALQADELHPHSMEESSSSSTAQTMKAPLRRNHKLGDRVTALQQLVSPFGKTDTASVLHEATIYIKLLQEQIQVLSNPYFRYRPSHSAEGGGGEEKYDLRSRGLCLVPLSSTVNLAKEAGSRINPYQSGRNLLP